MISRANIDDAVEGYIKSMLGALGPRFAPRFGPGDIPKSALFSMRMDVTVFVKENESLIRRAVDVFRVDKSSTATNWGTFGYDFAGVRNEAPGGRRFRFSEFGWTIREPAGEAARELDEAAWAFPRTALRVKDENPPEPGRLYFWTEAKR